MKKRILIAFLLFATAALVFSSCLVVARPRPVVGAAVVVGPPVEYGYEPLLYDGYVVYYTDDGIPFYWVGGVRYWVPVEFRAHYISHWHSHRHAYVNWYRHRGHHYRSQRYRGHKGAVRSGQKPKIRPKHDDGRPVIVPKDHDDSKPVIKPKKKKKDKPVIRPK